ncbi:MAG: hypothetical protein HC888_10355 [Candidatus Competibacteraceae bacterium]|nr:hypothetical protein [Candidatus Competibacteraceae bacterium]
MFAKIGGDIHGIYEGRKSAKNVVFLLGVVLVFTKRDMRYVVNFAFRLRPGIYKNSSGNFQEGQTPLAGWPQARQLDCDYKGIITQESHSFHLFAKTSQGFDPDNYTGYSRATGYGV